MKGLNALISMILGLICIMLLIPTMVLVLSADIMSYIMYLCLKTQYGDIEYHSLTHTLLFETFGMI